MAVQVKSKISIVSKTQAISRQSFHEHFYSLEKWVTLEKSLTVAESKDVIILPLDNAWGFPTRVAAEIASFLGPKFESELKTHIHQQYFGEQPRGTSFLLPWRGVTGRGNSKSPRYICCACMCRVPSALKADFTYSTIWSAMSCINMFNKELKQQEKAKKKEKSLKTIIIPEFSTFLDPANDFEAKLKDMARQFALALHNFLLGEIIEVEDIYMGEKRQKQIAIASVLSKREKIVRDLEALVWSRELETRGLCTFDELEVLIEWVNQGGNQLLSAANIIASLLKRPDTPFTLTQKQISERITGKGGCISPLLKLGVEGEVKFHEEIKRQELVFRDKIGSGNAGTVHKGTLKGKMVAIKTFSGDEVVERNEFMKEAVMLSLVKSQYIVGCFGACVVASDRFIVEELMESSLYDLLHDDSFELDDSLRVDWALQISSCMKFLHSCELIHRDLKSLNLLVGKTLEIKLCDFGLSRVVDTKKAMTSNIGTVSWIAPEVLLKKNYSEKADVYSYGIILWELVTRLMPFGDMDAFSVPLAVTRGERPEIPKNCPRNFRHMIKKCWDQRHIRRPAFEEIERWWHRAKSDLAAEHARLHGNRTSGDTNKRTLASRRRRRDSSETSSKPLTESADISSSEDVSISTIGAAGEESSTTSTKRKKKEHRKEKKKDPLKTADSGELEAEHSYSSKSESSSDFEDNDSKSKSPSHSPLVSQSQEKIQIEKQEKRQEKHEKQEKQQEKQDKQEKQQEKQEKQQDTQQQDKTS